MEKQKLLQKNASIYQEFYFVKCILKPSSCMQSINQLMEFFPVCVSVMYLHKKKGREKTFSL